MGIKISQIKERKEELLKSLRGVESPGKRKLIISIKDENWYEVVKELLFRIELYTSEKVLTYNRKTINDIVITINKIGLDELAEKLYDKIENVEIFN